MPDRDKVKFHYIKSHDFRVAHVDGAIGGLTPTGDIFISLYSQRSPIPTVTIQPVMENGELGEEIISERIIRDGIVRELEVGLAMRTEVAASLVTWLQQQIALREKLKKDSEKAKK